MIFTFSDRRHNFSSTPEIKLKRGGIQKNTEGGGYPCHSDRMSHFILEVKYYTTHPYPATPTHPTL